jgi:hypothetical protein
MKSQTSVERPRNVSPKVLYPCNLINVPAINPMTDINNIFFFFIYTFNILLFFYSFNFGLGSRGSKIIGDSSIG